MKVEFLDSEFTIARVTRGLFRKRIAYVQAYHEECSSLPPKFWKWYHRGTQIQLDCGPWDVGMNEHRVRAVERNRRNMERLLWTGRRRSVLPLAVALVTEQAT